ncbi:hypothetical protein MS3_00010740 [Schistosoma haematobium]|uniref:Uncharacterized protein n=2 Tax=Schistosoma haematobium TaxID=6185 RepID=A0A6A5DB42_SCHHA|nr:hypothetical protein MS3_00010740 [Schistosoma haematobium]KAH9584629.1 hypothetical protein MS3_00010740 [Schistosoma haematobium]
MVDHRGHEMHKSNQSNISTSVTSQVNDISVSNTVCIGNNNISTDRFRDDNLEEDETDEAEETIKMENVNNEKNRITHNYDNQTTDIVKMKSNLSNYTNQNDHSKSQNYDEFDSKSGIIYQKLDSFKKPYTHTITTTTTNITTNTITTVTTTNSTIPLTVKLNIHKENENNLEMSKDETMRNLARRTLAIGIPGLHPSNHKTLFIFSEENAIRKYSKIIIEWGYPFFFANFS